MTSRHYAEDRQYREENIQKYLGGEGKVVFDTVIYDTKRKNYYHYQITEHAVIIIKAIDKDLIITKLLARPTRLKRLWADVPQNILEIAIANSRDTRTVA